MEYLNSYSKMYSQGALKIGTPEGKKIFTGTNRCSDKTETRRKGSTKDRLKM
jgi:hypothetical protein